MEETTAVVDTGTYFDAKSIEVARSGGERREPRALILEEPGKPPRLVPLLRPRTVLGSGRDCDLRCAGRFVSRRHCAFMVDRDEVAIEDLHSRNGTEVDGVRVMRATVEPGALVFAGDVSATCVELVNMRSASLAGGARAGSAANVGCRFSGMVGADSGSLSRFHLINRVAASPVPVLIEGASGVGKELAARALHVRSPRRDGPLVTVNCGALPPTLAEAELFGHRRGAYTGATEDREGSFGLADGGTLFLDEVGELPESVQPKLLRALESGEIVPLGTSRRRIVDVRVVAATNRRLWREVADGRFRQDLLFRLSGVTIFIPPLSSRRDDIVPVAVALLEAFGEGREGAAPMGAGRQTLTMGAADWLEARPWPGNVRELRNLLAVASALTRRPELTEADLEAALVVQGGSVLAPTVEDDRTPKIDSMDRQILLALSESRGNRKTALRMLKIPRSTFYERLRKLRGRGLVGPGAPGGSPACAW